MEILHEVKYTPIYIFCNFSASVRHGCGRNTDKTADTHDAGLECRHSIRDAFGLLSYYGSESAGSLTLLSPDKPTAVGGTVALSDEELSARIRALPQQSLAAGAEKRMSLAGGLLVQAGTTLGLTEKRAHGQLTWMRARILDAAKALLAAIEVENARLSVELDIGPSLAGEARCLRAITYAVIQKMVQRLAPA